MIDQDLHPTSNKPPFKVMVSSGMTALIGISFLVGGVISFLHYPVLGLLFILIDSILIGVLSIAAAVSYWHLKSWGIYFHLFSIVHILLFTLFYPDEFLVWIGLIISFPIVILMAVYLKIKMVIVSMIIGIGLTCASFACQQMGPEIGVYGNMCEDQPQDLCYDELLGAGFPVHYVLDQPGISVMYRINMEDNFRIVPFLLDFLFYCAIVYGSIRIVRSYLLYKQKLVKGDISPT